MSFISAILKVRAKLIFVISVIAITSLGYSIAVLKDETALSMWALGLVLLFSFVGKIPESINKNQRYAGVEMLVVATIFAYYKFPYVAIFEASIAFVLFFFGIKVASYLLAPFFIWLWVIPHYASIHLSISYPMRILETKIVDLILSLLNYDASVVGTSIFVAGKEIIITTACSGIEHLWTLILLAWIASITMFKGCFVRAIFFACIVPIFVFCNALRVVITIVSMSVWGDGVLVGTPHFLYGIGTIVATMFAYILLGVFLKKIDLEGSF